MGNELHNMLALLLLLLLVPAPTLAIGPVQAATAVVTPACYAAHFPSPRPKALTYSSLSRKISRRGTIRSLAGGGRTAPGRTALVKSATYKLECFRRSCQLLTVVWRMRM